jgi:hypothetical protein
MELAGQLSNPGFIATAAASYGILGERCLGIEVGAGRCPQWSNPNELHYVGDAF